MSFDDDTQLDGAIDRLKQYIGARPENPNAHYNLGLAYVQKGRLEDAAFAFEMAIELDPNMVEAHINLGGLLLRQKKLDEAVAANEKALAINPKAVLAYNNIGFARMLQDRLEEAAQAFHQALELNPDMIPPRLSLARIHERLGDLDELIDQHEKIITVDPNFALSHYNLALAYMEKNDPTEALTHYKKAEALNYPVDPDLGAKIETALG